MDKYLKMFEPAMKSWLNGHYSEEEAKARWQKTVELDEKWIREEGDIGGSKNMMADNLLEAYAFFSFYEAVDRSFQKEDLDSLIDSVMGKKMQAMARFDMNKLEKKKWLIKFVYWFFEGYKKKADKHRGKDWGNTWEIRINPENHEKGIAFVFDTCPLNDFARKHGYIDFLPNLCAIDHLSCNAMHATLIRHKTLAAGDGECNYWIIGDQNPEALADSGSK